MARTLCFASVLALLAGCAGAAVPQGSAQSMSPLGARKSDLLYVSDWAAGSVYFYSYPGLRRVGALRVSSPTGLCADIAGNVFVANMERKEILEYGHGGSQPIATIADGSNRPTDCAVDPQTGNLAAVNHDFKAGLSIFRHAQGNPKVYVDPKIQFYAFCAYDARGNLFVDGERAHNQFELAELPFGKRAFVKIALDRTIRWAGGVQWDGTYLVVADQGINGKESVLYRFALQGNRGTTVGKVVLGDSLEVPQFWIDSAFVIGPDTGRDSGNVARIWAYPGGGAPIQTLGKLDSPIGATISRAQP